jgi:hypothetical protein
MTAPNVNPDFSQQGNSVFENVYIYDTLYANKVEFSDVADINLDTLRVKSFFAVGNADKLFNITNSTQRIGINTLNPDRRIVAIGDVGIGGTVDINDGRVGINSDYVDPTGDRVLEVGGSIRIVKDIYDQFNKRGNNTNVLSVDANGVFWKELSTEVQEGIFLQEEGVEVGQGVSFTNINFMERNSLGILTETLGITSSGILGLATVFSNDYWGNAIGGVEAVADHNIYRMTNVGIFTNNPLTALQIGKNTSGVVAITSEGNLGIGTTNPRLSLDVYGAASISGVTTLASAGGITTTGGDLFVDDGLSVGGAATVVGDLNVDGGDIKTNQTTFNLLNSTVTTLNLGGNATTIEIGKNDATGVININATKDSTSTTTGALVVDGGVGIAKRLTVDNVSIANTVGVGSTAYFEDEVDIDGTLILNSFIQDVVEETGNTVSTTLYKPTTASYDPANGNLTLTIANHGFVNNDLIRIADNSLTFKCAKDSNATEHTYPRLSDPASGKWLSVSSVSTNTFVVNVGKSGSNDQYAHTFISALDDCIIHSVGQYLKEDYRLSSVGTGVSWRPSGVETKKIIWVSTSGNDNNSGLLEGDAKVTIGAAAAIAQENDTIIVRPGVYDENNPIGLRTDVSITGQDLRLVTVGPKNLMRDIFHVRRGCLVENLNFSCNNVSTANTAGAAVAFPPTQADIDAETAYQAVSGFTDVGPATEGPTRRWRSPYVRNCTNFMTESTGMRIDGNHATASIDGANLKSMVCDSFTQYNEAGIGVSITNGAYAQLVSIFTINCDIGIYVDSGGQCDLTNSNSSFGNFGLVAAGLGVTQYTGFVTSNTAGVAYDVNNTDIIVGTAVTDTSNEFERPYDGQAVWFAINLANYPDVSATGRLTSPLREVERIDLIPNATGNTGFSALDPPVIIIQDFDDTLIDPKGPQAIPAQATATVSAGGSITEINLINSGRNYLPSQNIVVDINGNTGIATAVMKPIYFTVSEAGDFNSVGMTTITFNEFVPYELFEEDPIYFARISRILTSSHSFEYIGTGTTINSALPFEGAVPIKANEVVARDGAQIPFTSTDQKGNFDIGEGIQVDQTTSTIRGRDFSRSVQAELTPLILALN